MFIFMTSVKQMHKVIYFIFTKYDIDNLIFQFFAIYILNRQCNANISIGLDNALFTFNRVQCIPIDIQLFCFH